MAITLPTPSIVSVNVFDAKYSKDVEFYYIGNQPIKNRAVIVDNETLETIYDSTIDTLKLSHIIPADTLVNGKQYTIQIQVFDSNNDESELSDPILFYCYSTPYFDIEGIPEIYKAASIDVTLSYSQTEGELLKSYQYILYDNNKIVISKSDVLYDYGNSHIFYGLDNNRTYYVQCVGETIHGFLLNTDYKLINVVYDTIPADMLVQLENHRCSGYISLDTNMIVVDYELANDNYVLENDTLTLTDNSITYKDGFNIEDDFALLVEAKNLPIGTFIRGESSGFTLSVVSVCGVHYCEFKYKDYVIYKPFPNALVETLEESLITDTYGNVLEIISTEPYDVFIVIELKRIGNIYGLDVYYKQEKL